MFLKSVSLVPASIKSMNPMQKYAHITEWFACTRKNGLLVPSGTCSKPKLSK